MRSFGKRKVGAFGNAVAQDFEPCKRKRCRWQRCDDGSRLCERILDGFTCLGIIGIVKSEERCLKAYGRLCERFPSAKRELCK